MNRFFSAILAIFVALGLSACASQGGGQTQYPPEIRQGRIEQITLVSITHPHQTGVGAILGGVAGAGLGSLIGAGSGKDVAIAVGAIAGAVGGDYMEEKKDAPTPGQQIVVRLNSGVLVVITQPTNPALYVGQPVYVEGAGANASVVPRQ
jgi:outer membrane lipoprotein SlyB